MIYQGVCKDLEHQNNKLQKEISNLNNINSNEALVRNENNREIDYLTKLLNDTTDQLNKAEFDNKALSSDINEIINENRQAFAEIEKLKDKIVMLNADNLRVRLIYIFI